MYNQGFSHMNKSVHSGLSFSLNVQIVQAKMNLYPSLPIDSLISTYNRKDENIINNQ